jgi:predicted metal-dependent hydrolase
VKLGLLLKPKAEPVLPVFEGGGRSRPLTLRRMAGARRMRLSVDPRDGAVRLCLPARAPLRAALEWAEGQRAWVEATLAELPDPRPITPGAVIPFEGATLVIDWQPNAGRALRIEAGRLILGGARESVGPRVLRWLRHEALSRLERETREIGARAGVQIGHVSIGDPRARWGSCSSSGDIRYAWRLILAPVAVREATVAHEVAHRLHMDHGPAFHAAVERLLERDPKAERAWLRKHGAALYWVGREG